jgi:hypothetical protein
MHAPPSCLAAAGDPAFDYLARTIPQLRPPRALEGLADYLIELSSAGDKGRAGAEIAEAYARSQLKARNDKEIQVRRGRGGWMP